MADVLEKNTTKETTQEKSGDIFDGQKYIDSYRTELKQRLSKNKDLKLAKVEYDEANAVLKGFEYKLKQKGIERQKAIEEIKKGTKGELYLLSVEDFEQYLKGIRIISKNRTLFGDSYPKLIAILSNSQNNELGENLYEAFKQDNIEDKLNGQKFEIKDVSDVRNLLKFLNSSKVNSNEILSEKEKLKKFKLILKNFKSYKEEYPTPELAEKAYQEMVTIAWKLYTKTGDKKDYNDLNSKFIEYNKQDIVEKRKDTAKKKEVLKNTAEKRKNTAEKRKNTAEKRKNTAEKRKNTAEKRKNTAEKRKDIIDLEKYLEKKGIDFKNIDMDKINEKQIKKLNIILSLVPKYFSKNDYKDIVNKLSTGNVKISDLEKFSPDNIKKLIKKARDKDNNLRKAGGEKVEISDRPKGVVEDTSERVAKTVEMGKNERELKSALVGILGREAVDKIYSSIPKGVTNVKEVEPVKKGSDKETTFKSPVGKDGGYLSVKTDKDGEKKYSVKPEVDSNLNVGVDIEDPFGDGGEMLKEKNQIDEKIWSLEEENSSIEDKIKKLKAKQESDEGLTPEEENELIQLEEKLEKNKQKLEDEKEKLESLMNAADKEIIKLNKEKIEKASRIAKFLQKIGWDLIPEYARNTIIKELKNGNYLASGVGITPAHIDIDKGLFGEAIIGEDGLGKGNAGEKIFAKLMNKIVTGRSDGKYEKDGKEKTFINVNNIGEDVVSDSDLGKIGGYNEAVMREKIAENGISLAYFDLKKTKENLSKQEKNNYLEKIENNLNNDETLEDYSNFKLVENMGDLIDNEVFSGLDKKVFNQIKNGNYDFDGTKINEIDVFVDKIIKKLSENNGGNLDKFLNYEKEKGNGENAIKFIKNIGNYKLNNLLKSKQEKNSD